MFRSIACSISILLIGTSLAGCGRHNDNNAVTNDPLAATSSRQEDQFGTGFGEAFRADPNAQPRNVTDNDVQPVSSTTDPVNID